MIRNPSQPGYLIRRSRRRAKYRITLIALLIAFSILFISVKLFSLRVGSGIDENSFIQLWEAEAFDEVYSLSSIELSQNPLDFFLLTIHGFSSYQMAIAQISNFYMLQFMDNCIYSLRKALLLNEGYSDGRVFYVLGKAYYYKGSGYGDLAIKYLEKALNTGFDASDIYEYLGLAYASVRDFQSSVEAFTLALDPFGTDSSSDALFLAIADSFIALGEEEEAKAYLIRCMDTSRDSNMVFTARLNLGDLYLRNGDVDAAEEQFIKVIEESTGNADAHFRLGEVHNARGELVRSRAEWRRAIQIDPSHRLARARLNL